MSSLRLCYVSHVSLVFMFVYLLSMSSLCVFVSVTVLMLPDLLWWLVYGFLCVMFSFVSHASLLLICPCCVGCVGVSTFLSPPVCVYVVCISFYSLFCPPHLLCTCPSICSFPSLNLPTTQFLLAMFDH